MTLIPPVFERTQIGNIRIHVLPTDRFKTFSISAYIGTPLHESSVTSTALIPFILRRGNSSFPETKHFREKLDDLYGSSLGFDIMKRGDHQITQFRMDIIDDRYVKQNSSLLEEGLHFFTETLFRPAMNEGVFLPAYVESEKISLCKKLESVINDKGKYAAKRCLEEMCKEEPYRLYPLGRIEDLDHINPETLTARYKIWLKHSPIDLYVVGSTSLSQVESIIRSILDPLLVTLPATYKKNLEPYSAQGLRTVMERLDVNQGKLNLGMRLPITYADERYAAALMFNGILGGYAHSKLFVNVREKESLAYYASSQYDGHKGIVTIQSGIETGNYDKAVAIIRKQVEEIQTGNISELELNQTKAMISNQLLSIHDGAFDMIAFDFNSFISGKERTVDSLIQDIDAILPDQIQQVAKEASLEMIYFLRDRKGGVNDATETI